MNDFIDNPGPFYPTAITYALIGTGIAVALHLLFSLGARQRNRPRGGLFSKLVYIATVVSVGVLGATAFYATLAHGAMHGWLLFAHLGGAGAFAAALFFLALTWSQPSRFRPCCEGSASCNPNAIIMEDEQAIESERFPTIAKLAFWVMLVSGLLTLASMLVSMMPWYGTADMLRWLDIHRYAGLTLFVATVIHLYLVLMARMGKA